MKAKIVLEHDEVLEAVKAYLEDKGLVEDTDQLDHSNVIFKTNKQKEVSVTVLIDKHYE